MPVRIDGTGSVSGLTNYTAENFTTTNLTATDATVTGDITNPSFDALELAPRNLIINGEMAVAQRGTGWADVVDIGGGSFLVDRFRTFHFAGTGGTSVLEQEQSSDVPTGQGFKTSLALRVKTAQSLPNDGYVLVSQAIEGYNINSLEFGSAEAKDVTVSFWAKSSVAGTYSLVLRNINATRTYAKDYTLEADTWKHVTLTYPGETSGTWNVTDGSGLQVMWALDTGSTWNTAPDVWNTSNLFGSTNQTNAWTDTTNNTFYLTGVQVTATDTALPFQHEDYGTTLRKCERYFVTRRLRGVSTAQSFVYPVKMRTTPSVTQDGSITIGTVLSDSAIYTATSNTNANVSADAEL